jgi:2-C-methyl-D-erythritol 2,4-cyclodiphosphate synthase
MRIGLGYDIHRLVPGRKLVLGGVEIPFCRGEDGHSDGDVLAHAIIDALFGAAGLGDIGTHFPPSDPAYKNISSLVLLKKAYELISEKGWEIINIDTNIILQEPKIAPHAETIKNRLAETLSIPAADISVKAKTKEKMDAAGRGEAVEAQAAVLIKNKAAV